MTKKINREELAALSKMLEMVGIFNITFQLPVARTWEDSSLAGRQLYANLIQEEFDEFVNATTKIDRLDAICDLQYVGLGAMIATGLRTNQLELNAFQKPLAAVSGNAIVQLRNSCLSGCMLELPALALTLFRAGPAFATDYPAAFRTVHENNMTKRWTKQEVGALDPAEFKVTPIPVSSKYLVHRKSDGKLVKPPSFTAVDLTPYVK